ncbi:uncharacterized protein LOC120260063 [Dioscorea cayenensis subsp. rotundata]|uniref:Uncharacterized protein LOC120260063 n=1 Tax=Dioscorea cayennensis subsp. rotundata TaxID=55577 RepID=A0AB40B8E0_DIOCR|nr:uncharacterized protein LOC120260063 [Dioscorea cayenensis subsp. rotundata]
MASPKIQKELANAFATEITCAIVDDIRDKYFSLMIDEARDVSVKEQMGVVLLRGQGYDGASNMRGKFNGLKALFLKENPYARYNHCFAHQLQLVIVAIAKDNHIMGRASLTHFHHYRVEIFCEIIDLIAQEMQNRFSKTSAELLLLLSCLDPKDSFSKFNIHKLLRLVELYPEDFTITEDFINVEDLGGFARKMVETSKPIIFSLIYRLIELPLVLPVVTASVERVFSVMNILKTNSHNKMGDEWMNDILVIYIEREVFATIDNEAILQHFQKMHTRRMQLPPLSLSHMPHISGTNIGIGSSSSVHK